MASRQTIGRVVVEVDPDFDAKQLRTQIAETAGRGMKVKVLPVVAFEDLQRAFKEATVARLPKVNVQPVISTKAMNTAIKEINAKNISKVKLTPIIFLKDVRAAAKRVEELRYPPSIKLLGKFGKAQIRAAVKEAATGLSVHITPQNMKNRLKEDLVYARQTKLLQERLEHDLVKLKERASLERVAIAQKAALAEFAAENKLAQKTAEQDLALERKRKEIRAVGVRDRLAIEARGVAAERVIGERRVLQAEADEARIARLRENHALILERRVTRSGGILQRFDSSLTRVLQRTSGLETFISRMLKRTAIGFGVWGAGIAASFAVIAGAAIIQFARVEQAAAQAASILAFDEIRKEFGALNRATTSGILATNQTIRHELIKSAQDVAAATVFGTKEATEGYVALAQAGLDTRETIATLPTVARFAQAGFLDLGEASDALVQSYITAGFETDKIGQKLPRLADLLIFAANDSVTSLDEILKAFTNRSAATFATYGQRIEETVNVLNLFARAGVTGLKAGMQASIVIRELTRAANKAPDAWKKFGVEIANVDGTTRSTAAVLDDFVSKLREQGIVIRSSDGHFKTLGKRYAQLKADLELTERSSTGIQQLIPQIATLQAKGQSATSELNRLTKESVGSLTTQSIGVRDTLAAQFETFVNQISNLGAVFAAKAGRNLTRFFEDLNGGILQGEGLQKSLDPLAKKFGERFNILIRNALQQFRGRGGRELFRGITEGFRSTLRGIQKFFSEFSRSIDNGAKGTRTTIGSIGNAFAAIGKVFETLAPEIGRALGIFTNLIVENADAFRVLGKAAVIFWLVLKPIRLVLAPLAAVMSILTARTIAQAAATQALAAAQTEAAVTATAESAALTASSAALGRTSAAMAGLGAVMKGGLIAGAIVGVSLALKSIVDSRIDKKLEKTFAAVNDAFASDALSQLQTSLSDAQGAFETYHSAIADAATAQDAFVSSATRLISSVTNADKQPLFPDKALNRIKSAADGFGKAAANVDKYRESVVLARSATGKSLDVANDDLKSTQEALRSEDEKLGKLREYDALQRKLADFQEKYGNSNLKLTQREADLVNARSRMLFSVSTIQDRITERVGTHAEIQQKISDSLADTNKLELERIGIDSKLNELGSEADRLTGHKVNLQDAINQGLEREISHRSAIARESLGQRRREIEVARFQLGAAKAQALEKSRSKLFAGIFTATKPEDILIAAGAFDKISRSFIKAQTSITGAVNTKKEISTFVTALQTLNSTPAGNQLLTTFGLNMRTIAKQAENGKLDVNKQIRLIGATPTGREFLATLGLSLDDAAKGAKKGGHKVGVDFTSGVKNGVSDSKPSLDVSYQRVMAQMRTAFSLVSGIGNAAGVATIGGLQDGIDSELNEKSGFTAKLHDVSQWIRDHKGPISADRGLLVPAGVAIMQGLTSGLEHGFGPMKSFITGIAPSISEAIPSSLFDNRAAEFAVKLAMGEAPDVDGFFSGIVSRYRGALEGAGAADLSGLDFLHPTLSLADTTEMAKKLGAKYGLGIGSIFRPYDTVAGSGVSQHLLGQAADLSNGTLTAQEFRLARDMSGLVGDVFRQVIFNDHLWGKGGKNIGHVPDHKDHVHLGWMGGAGFNMLSGRKGGATAAGVPESIAAIIRRASEASGVSNALLEAVAKVESNFNPRAVSPAGARGLFQMLPSTFAGFHVGNDIFDPMQNATAASRYLKNLLKMFGGNIKFALAGYNAGPGAVQRYKGVPPYSETQNYVERVLESFRSFGGYREMGGPISRSKSYMVGEAGPELFVPHTNGFVMSNDKLERMIRMMEGRGSAASGKIFSPTVNVQTNSRDPEITAALVMANMRSAFAGVDIR